MQGILEWAWASSRIPHEIVIVIVVYTYYNCESIAMLGMKPFIRHQLHLFCHITSLFMCFIRRTSAVIFFLSPREFQLTFRAGFCSSTVIFFLLGGFNCPLLNLSTIEYHFILQTRVLFDIPPAQIGMRMFWVKWVSTCIYGMMYIRQIYIYIWKIHCLAR